MCYCSVPRILCIWAFYVDIMQRRDIGEIHCDVRYRCGLQWCHKCTYPLGKMSTDVERTPLFELIWQWFFYFPDVIFRFGRRKDSNVASETDVRKMSGKCFIGPKTVFHSTSRHPNATYFDDHCRVCAYIEYMSKNDYGNQCNQTICKRNAATSR